MEEENDNLYDESENSVPDEAPSDFDENDDFHLFLMLACKRKGVIIPTIKSLISQYKRVALFVNAYEDKFGKDAWTSFQKNLVFEVRDGKFGYNLFAVICAIRSCL
jgi:hypothetical protein